MQVTAGVGLDSISDQKKKKNQTDSVCVVAGILVCVQVWCSFFVFRFFALHYITSYSLIFDLFC